MWPRKIDHVTLKNVPNGLLYNANFHAMEAIRVLQYYYMTQNKIA